jgi:hypothetical protein
VVPIVKTLGAICFYTLILNFDSEFKGVDLYWNAYILVFNQNGANAKQHLKKKLQVSKEQLEFLQVCLGIQILPGLWVYRISVFGSEGPKFESRENLLHLLLQNYSTDQSNGKSPVYI